MYISKYISKLINEFILTNAGLFSWNSEKAYVASAVVGTRSVDTVSINAGFKHTLIYI